MSHFTSLFGENLNKNGETVNTADHLNGKHVLIYFSAHWCPPCRGFTPKLAEFYNNFQKTTKVPFEIVFASSDKDESAFGEYYETMPWVALPYNQREKKEALSAKYKVAGIPTLVVLSPEGELITNKGRDMVSSDPSGERFPWKPRTIMQVLESGPLQSKSGEVAASSLKGKNFGIYFSAHWCPPCRGFTPKLVETYNSLKQQNKDFEIIFVSSDRDAESYAEYFESMPWLSIGFKDPRKEELSTICDVEGIPQFTLVNENGEVVTHNGRSFVSEDPEGKEFPWKVKPLQNISMCGSEINSEPCVVGLFSKDTDNSDLIEMMKPIAEKYCESAKKGETDEIHFFYSEGSGIGDRIASLFSIDTSKPCVVLLNIPKGWSTCEATKEAAETMVNDFTQEKLSLNPMPAR